MSSFTFLLFSSLRLGAEEWGATGAPSPQFIQKLADDILYVQTKLGALDAILLAGDITESGQPEQFASCSELFEYLFSRIPDRPMRLCVPGDHDLLREPEAPAITQSRKAPYYRLLGAARYASKQYLAWSDEWMNAQARRGEWPGDFSLRVSVRGALLDIIGLNTELQEQLVFAGADRILALSDQPRPGTAENWLRLLLTRYPPWVLESFESRKPYLDGELFQLHLCGQYPVELLASRATGSPTVLICPPLCPKQGSPAGYVAGRIDLNEPAVHAWSRHLGDDRAWRAAHEVDTELTQPLHRPKRAGSTASTAPENPVYVESIYINGFRSFERIQVQFRRESRMPGEWTCIAGINGAGKSSILQALCIALLGDPLARELGGGLLNRMRRMSGADTRASEIKAVLTTPEDDRMEVVVTISDEGNLSCRCDPPDVWQRLRGGVVAAYGATRNLTSRLESGYENLSADVRRMITMFDPLSQLSSAVVRIRRESANGTVVRLFVNLVGQIFGEELKVDMDAGSMRFTVSGCDRVEAIDLPDGFRASAAWMADLCAIWAAKYPEKARSGDPSEMHGIVLIDEIDLHLHPALQRSLVPKLRAVLPKVQWIVTTHSPLVLANFDSNEIIALDRSREDNVRTLDRQILGFTSDQIYQWLMGTTPTGEAIEKELERNEATGEPSDDEVAALLTMSPTVGESEAKEKVHSLKSTIERLRP